MPIPTGVKTVLVDVVPPLNEPATNIRVTVAPSQNLTWSATGQALATMLDDHPSPGWVRLPAVDQVGFVAGATPVTNFSYIVHAEWISGGVAQSHDGVIQPESSDAILVLTSTGGGLAAPMQALTGGVALSGIVATYAALPAQPVAAGTALLVAADGFVYVSNGSAWPANGAGWNLRGPTGPPGEWFEGAGVPGTVTGAADSDMYVDTVTGDVYQLHMLTWSLIMNIKGPRGLQGDTGNTGRAAQWWTGSGAPGTVTGSGAGDMYLDTGGTGNVYAFDGFSWTLKVSIKGTIGNTGARGSQWFTGSGAPGTVSGAINGDMYLDTSGTGKIYALASGTWSLSTTIVGAQGVTGPAAHWFTGSGAPGTQTGQLNGDMYLDTASGTVYQLQSGTWTSVANIMGPAGSPPNATTSAPGLVQLAGDLGGTATAPTVPGLGNKAPLANPVFTGTPQAPTPTAGTNTTQIATTAFVQNAALVTGGTAAMKASQTAAYTAVAGDFVPCSASAGAFTVTLPTAPANGTRVTVMKTDASTNAVTVARGGTTDVFNVASGPTSLVLTSQFAVVSLEYAAATGIWYNQEAGSPCKFTWLVQSGTRAAGYGDMPEGIYFDQAATIFAVRFRAGTADASGSNTVALYSNTTGAATGTAITSGSTTLTATSAGAVAVLTGPWSIAAGTYLQVNVTALGTTPGARLYLDVIGTYI